MVAWTVQTDRNLGSLVVRRHHEHPVDRYEDRGPWRVFFSDGSVVAARHDAAYHQRVDLTEMSKLLPANLVAEMRRIADEAQTVSSDVTASVHTS